MKQIILASESPRRREILSSLGVVFTVLPAHADEHCSLTDPGEFVEELARRKGQAVLSNLDKTQRNTSDTVIISADTVVVAGGSILGKPANRDEAYTMLKLLSGNTHQVMTGVGITVNGTIYTDHSVTNVTVDTIPEEELLAYIDSGDPMDKAGAYGIQGAFSRWISGISGCYFGVVGLPIHLVNRLYHSCTGEYLGKHPEK